MPRLFIFGLGYSAKVIATLFESKGWEVISTGREGTISFEDETSIRLALADTDHVLSSVPPGRESRGEPLDAVLENFEHTLRGIPLSYLSSTGVYGDRQGAWVDESTPCSSGRRTARMEADAQWLSLDARVYRLPGIYGPGRSIFERLAEGRAHRITMPGQVFSRIHVEDIARGVFAGIHAKSGAYNLADNLPCPQNWVVEEACRLKGITPPRLLTLEEANLSPMAQGFYAENRRVANSKARRILGWSPLYPTYVEGLRTLNATTSPIVASTAPAPAKNVQL